VSRTQIDEFFTFVAFHRNTCDGAVVDLDLPDVDDEHGTRLGGVCRRCAAVFATYLSRSEADDFIYLIEDDEAYDAAVRCAQRRVVQ